MSEHLIWAIVGAAIGTVMALATSIAYEYALLIRNPSKMFFGKWHSSWQPTATPGWYWVSEDLFIERRFGKIFIRNENNTRDFAWRGRAKIVRDRFLVGEWKSMWPGSKIDGTFTLLISYNGKYMYGFFFVPDAATKKIVSAFVLGRELEDVESGKQRLKQSKIDFAG